jgi:FkbM family methyltransferase
MRVGFKFHKLGYYLYAVTQLLKGGVSFPSLLRALRGVGSSITISDGLTFNVYHPMDVLVLAESISIDVYCTKLLKDPRLVVDVGAGFGDLSLSLAKRFPACSILAFEPNPNQFNRLSQNIKLNSLSNVSPHQTAIGPRGEISMFHGDFDVAASQVRAAYHSSELKVQSRPLSDFVDGWIDFLKLDCEGVELEILRALPEETLRRTGIVALEYHNHLVPGESEAVRSLLSGAGFSCQVLQDRYEVGLGYMIGVNMNKV